MATPLFCEIFGDFLSQELREKLNGAILKKCNLDTENRTLLAGLFCDTYISRGVLVELTSSIKSLLKLENCNITAEFSSAAFGVSACEDLVNEIRQHNALLNGYFNGAEYALDGDTLTINLKHGGYKKIVATKFEDQFIRLVNNRFGRECVLRFEGQLDDVKIEMPEVTYTPAPPKAEKKVEEKPQIKFEARREKPENGVVYLDNPQLFYGRRIDNNVKRMIDVTPDDMTVCCWGEVFGYDTRKINTKRGEAVIVNFSVSDYTNSISASLFMDPKKMGDISNLKNGNFVLINGNYEFDNYRTEHIIKPTAIALLQPYFEMDEYEGEKRIELHCHTNMSDKDAVCPAEDLITQS